MKWVVDEAAALVVKRIFKLCMEGRGPMQIAKLLQEEKGAWYAYNGQKIGQGKENVKILLKENRELFNEINEKVRAHYNFNGANGLDSKESAE